MTRKVRLQLKLGEDEVRALKLGALLADMTVSELVMECFNYCERQGYLSREARLRATEVYEARAKSKRGERGEPGDWELMCREEELRNRELLSESG